MLQRTCYAQDAQGMSFWLDQKLRKFGLSGKRKSFPKVDDPLLRGSHLFEVKMLQINET